ncbi:hypothetical protein M404DRAFT_909114 [Pisolithus tinctorius Marx 270]|uniref:Uncharacterized protein n=1 Tax=Pisolithus tinctorius Marx 270 TaxID=870435 RepID=A0A0C3PNN5_PISTI|nr:hypothetical protein M404DRAFT_909114 [Pisolithus tinctorius Marx 270]
MCLESTIISWRQSGTFASVLRSFRQPRCLPVERISSISFSPINPGTQPAPPHFRIDESGLLNSQVV